MKRYGVYSFSFILLIGMLMGCKIHTIKSSEFETFQSGTPLINIKARTFAFKEFSDVRETKDPSQLLEMWHLDQPPSRIVRTAIKKELERNGHLCIDYSPEAKADFIIEGAIYKHWITCRHGLGAIVAVKLTVSKFSNDKVIFTKTYEGEYDSNHRFGTWLGDTFKHILSMAYLAMLKEMATDADLIEFLEK
jgi:hypothetical protein